MGVSWWVSGWLGASDGAWTGWSHQHQHQPPTANISVWSDARQRKTLARWVRESPSEKKQYRGVNNKYVCTKKIITTPKRKKQSTTHINNYTKCKHFFPAFKTTCCIYYCCTDSRAQNTFPSWKRWVELKNLRAGHRRTGSTRSERRKIKHALGRYGRDCCRGVCMARFTSCTLWNTTLAT